MLNVLLITLGLAWLTELAGLSLALGAFLAGMLISETEYRYQVEEDIKPFRDVLLGLFFVTVGMQLDIAGSADGLAMGRARARAADRRQGAGRSTGLSRLFGADPGAALRTGLALAQARRVRFGAAGAGRRNCELMPPAVTADRARGDGAVDAGRALHHRAQRAHRAPLQRRRMDESRDGAAQHRRAERWPPSGT